jgi:hypothetical protein
MSPFGNFFNKLWFNPLQPPIPKTDQATQKTSLNNPMLNSVTNTELSNLTDQKEEMVIGGIIKKIDSYFGGLNSGVQKAQEKSVESQTQLAEATQYRHPVEQSNITPPAFMLVTNVSNNHISKNHSFSPTQSTINTAAYSPATHPMMPPAAPYNNSYAPSNNSANIEVNPVINVTVNGDSYESTAKDIAEKIKLVIQEVFESASRRQGFAGVQQWQV